MRRAGALVLALVLGSCGGGGAAQPRCGDGHLDPNEECDDGNNWNNDGCSSVCMLEIAHTGFTANVGINRGIVPEYDAGDSCGTVAKLLVIDAIGPGGALPRQELDCTQGYNGWRYFDVPGGHYTVTMQLFDLAGTDRVPLTEQRTAETDVPDGTTGTTVYVDYTYRDFTLGQPYVGNLKWQVTWASALAVDAGVGDGGVGDGGVDGGFAAPATCELAQPPVVQERFTLRDDQGTVVNDTAVLQTATATYSTRTNGSEKVSCHDYGTSDAEVVSSLPWGVYELTVEGFDATNQVAYCVRQNLFAPNGEGIIFHLVADAGPCP